MSILGIGNRTENWRTVRYFYGLSGDAKASLTRHLLANHLRTRPDMLHIEPDDVQIELFWKGMRDYLHIASGGREKWTRKFADVYSDLFAGLRDWVGRPDYGLKLNQERNYDVSKAEYWSGLYTNLTGTEIDIVLKTPAHLFIGEAKDESTLRGKGKYVLVHQLIRQYVMAKTLVTLARSDKESLEIVPFIVGTNLSSIRKSGQVRLMLDKGWLRNENIVGWGKIKAWTAGV